MSFFEILRFCTWIVYIFIWIFFGFNLIFLWREGRLFWRGISWRVHSKILAAAVFMGICAAASLRGIVLRGGYDSEHDFSRMSMDFIGAGHDSGRLWDLFAEAEKELSPLAIFSLFDAVSRNSLEGILSLQKALWFLCAILLALVLRRNGMRAAACLGASGFFLWSFLSLLSANSFSTTHANLFFVLSSVLSLAAWRSSRDPEESAILCLWFFSAAFLVFTSRFEFVPPLLWGMVLVLAGGAWKPLKKVWADPPLRRRFFIALLLIMTAYAGWGFYFLSTGEVVKGSWRHSADNLNYHLGQQNLEPVLGIPASWHFFLVCAALAVALIRGIKNRKKEGMFWPLFLSGWIVYFSLIFLPLSVYPLQFTRHHLYFFLPFIFLAALLLKDMRSVGHTAVLAILAVYGFLNVAHARRLNPLVRTNDIEWQFLLDSRHSWPSSCQAVYGVEDSRRRLLSKYFPSQNPQEGEASCLLEYQSPLYEAIDFHQGEIKIEPQRPGSPWREIEFSHRFYTDWHGPWAARFEFMDRRPLRMGFYFIREAPALKGSVSSGAQNFSLGHIRPYHLLRTLFTRGYEHSLDFCHKKTVSSYWRYRLPGYSLESVMEAQGQSAFAATLDCFGRALQSAQRLNAGMKMEAEILLSRGMIFLALGDRSSARRDLGAALKKAPSQWRRRRAAENLIKGL